VGSWYWVSRQTIKTAVTRWKSLIPNCILPHPKWGVENSTHERTTCQANTQWLTIDLAVIFVIPGDHWRSASGIAIGIAA
jgi:hypothetical protein